MGASQGARQEIEQSSGGKECRADSKSYIEQLEAERLSPNRLAETTKEMMPIPKIGKLERRRDPREIWGMLDLKCL